MSKLAQISEIPSRLKLLVWIQVAIAILAIGVSTYVGLKIKPLIEQRHQLEIDVQEYEEKIQHNRKRLENSREAVGIVSDGISYFYHNNYERAIERFNEALELDQGNVYILNWKGYTLFKVGRFTEALDALHNAVNVDPNYPWSYVDLARSYCATGNLKEAEEAVKKAVELKPDLKNYLKDDEEFARGCKSIISTLD